MHFYTSKLHTFSIHIHFPLNNGTIERKWINKTVSGWVVGWFVDCWRVCGKRWKFSVKFLLFSFFSIYVQLSTIPFNTTSTSSWETQAVKLAPQLLQYNHLVLSSLRCDKEKVHMYISIARSFANILMLELMLMGREWLSVQCAV